MVAETKKEGFVLDIMDATDPRRVYLRRFHLLRTKYLGIYVHKICLPDNDRYPHSHPWSFFSLILKGGYEERYVNEDGSTGVRSCKPGTLRWVPRRGYWHSVRRLYGNGPTWSLVVRGPRHERRWGYLAFMQFLPADRRGGEPGRARTFDGDDKRNFTA